MHAMQVPHQWAGRLICQTKVDAEWMLNVLTTDGTEGEGFK